MNCEFIDKEPETTTQENIICDGEVVGWMKTYTGRDTSRYHAGLELRACGAWGLLQGHGSTKEAAIMEALIEGKENALDVIRQAEAYAEKFGEVLP